MSDGSDLEHWKARALAAERRLVQIDAELEAGLGLRRSNGLFGPLFGIGDYARRAMLETVSIRRIKLYPVPTLEDREAVAIDARDIAWHLLVGIGTSREDPSTVSLEFEAMALRAGAGDIKALLVSERLFSASYAALRLRPGEKYVRVVEYRRPNWSPVRMQPASVISERRLHLDGTID